MKIQSGSPRWLVPVALLAVAAAAMARAAATPQSSSPAVHAAPANDIGPKLLEQGFRDLGAYAALERLLSVGPRLTGSPEADAAVALMARHLRDLGFENVHTEPTEVGHWVRGPREEGRIVSGTLGSVDVKVRAIGNSIATPEAGITAGVLEVHSLAELEQAGNRARGKLVFFNGPMDPTFIDTFQAYGQAVPQRSGGAVAAARAGAVGAVVRSMTLALNDDPHTGTMSYDPAVPQVPAVMISTLAANRLSEMLAKDPDLRVHVRTSCRTLAPVTSHNVMGEIRGTEEPGEVIVVGGHLDSWDLSPGAHDDGSGCAQAIEALRLIREAGLRPKRTIRVVLFMDEENGGTGGRDYARSEARRGERHVAAIESDRGGFLPLGIGAGGTDVQFARIKAWEPLVQQVGLQWIRPGGGGVDIGPLGASGTVLLGLVPDSQRYFDVHHSGIDTIDKVNGRELEMGAVAIALVAYLIAENGL